MKACDIFSFTVIAVSCCSKEVFVVDDILTYLFVVTPSWPERHRTLWVNFSLAPLSFNQGKSAIVRNSHRPGRENLGRSIHCWARWSEYSTVCKTNLGMLRAMMCLGGTLQSATKTISLGKYSTIFILRRVMMTGWVSCRRFYKDSSPPAEYIRTFDQVFQKFYMTVT